MPQKLSSFFGKTLTASASGINTTSNFISNQGSFGDTNELPSGTSLNVVPTSSTAIAGLFSGTTSSDMVRITQLGTGNALVVEDSANSDATPFVVTGTGSVGIGTTNPLGSLQVGVGTSIVLVTSTGSVGIGTTNPLGSLQVGAGSSIVLVTSSGSVGIGTTNPQTPLQVERYGVKTGLGTFNATVGVTTDIDSFTISVTDFKTVEYTLHFINSSNIQAQKVLVMQNSTTAYSAEYAIMWEPNHIVSVGSTVSSGICKLQVTPEVGISGLTTYRFTREAML